MLRLGRSPRDRRQTPRHNVLGVHSGLVQQIGRRFPKILRRLLVDPAARQGAGLGRRAEGGRGGGRSHQFESEAVPQTFLDPHNVPSLLGFEEEYRGALASGAAGASGAVDVAVRVAGGLVLDDQVHVGDVDPPGGHVGGDQDVEGADAEGVEGGVALFLSDVAVEGLGGEALEDPARDELVGVAFGLGEDDGLAEDLLLDGGDGAGSGSEGVGGDGVVGRGVEGGSGVGFVGLHAFGDFDGDDVFDDGMARSPAGGQLDGEVADGLGGPRSFIFGGGVDHEGVLLVAAGDLGDPRRSGGAEHEHLRLVLQRLARPLQHPLHLLREAHVEHLVRLVQNGRLHLRQIQIPPFDVIDEPAGGAHHHVRPPSQRPGLRVYRDPPVEHVHGQSQRLRRPAELVRDLPSQLPGGTQD
mmetsp:Transcript_11572/g.25334  ORF Transcript_11572/g.25334 Transcript_11572/m.25334 type:complete len:412 (+) Transcript_11572:401-1636(+)